jgi:hypothetical protein
MGNLINRPFAFPNLPNEHLYSSGEGGGVIKVRAIDGFHGNVKEIQLLGCGKAEYISKISLNDV